MEQNFTICSPQELTNVSSALAKLMQETHKRVILLNGNLGTGKTTFVKEFVSSKNVDVEVDSPTFSIVKRYIHSCFCSGIKKTFLCFIRSNNSSKVF